MIRKSTTTGMAVSVLVGSMLLASCGAGGRSEGSSGTSSAGSAESPGVTDTSVKIGAHYPLTGVAAPGYSEIPSGAKAYYDYVNAQGGIHGRKIDLVVKDDAYVPTNTTQVVNELVQKDQVFAIVGGLGTPTHSAVVDFLNDEKVPVQHTVTDIRKQTTEVSAKGEGEIAKYLTLAFGMSYVNEISWKLKQVVGPYDLAPHKKGRIVWGFTMLDVDAQDVRCGDDLVWHAEGKPYHATSPESRYSELQITDNDAY